jgi:hypothetical protein
MRRLTVMMLLLWMGAESIGFAQTSRRVYAGGLFGVSTLSADGRSLVTPPQASVSLYKPENGLALNAFAGVHLHPYLTVQGNYVWNRNDVSLLSSLVTPSGGAFYEQARGSAQHTLVADVLLYFRSLDSRVRPYLSTGIGIVRFHSNQIDKEVTTGLVAPRGAIRATEAGLRVAVGIDMAMSDRWSFRYSFSETISRNPISAQLAPRGERGLANFQNLFGLVLTL